MSDFSQLEAPVLAPTLVLLVMGLLSLVTSLSFHLKSRAIRKLPKGLSVNVFDKTFNVLSPYPDQREMIHGSLVVSFPVVIIFADFVFSYVLLATIVQMGLLVGLITFLLCAALMSVTTSSETSKNASLLARAIKNEADLGLGDLTALSTVEKTLPRLGTYYFSLGVIFLAFSMMMPYILPSVMSIFMYSLGVIVALTASGGIIGPVYALLLFVVAVTMIRVAVTKVKTGIFGLPWPETSISLDEPFEAVRARAGFYYVWEHDQLLRRPPFEETQGSDQEESETLIES